MITKEKEKIRGMFSEISENYDRANSILSLGMHHLWKQELITKALELSKQGQILDVCMGTGDILKGLLFHKAQAFGIDFTFNMLKNSKIENIRFAQADALKMPFAESSFEVATVSYGIRNFESLEVGLKEILRILKPGGTLLILEFGEKPKGLIGYLIRLYEERILPMIGGLLSGKPAAYKYLAQSSNEFPSGNKLIEICKNVGFVSGKFKSICFGATYLYEIKAQ